MRTTTVLVAGAVGASTMLIAFALAFGFGVSLTGAASQMLPLALACALLAGLMVELDRRASW